VSSAAWRCTCSQATVRDYMYSLASANTAIPHRPVHHSSIMYRVYVDPAREIEENHTTLLSDTTAHSRAML